MSSPDTPLTVPTPLALTVFNARAGDHNERGMAGARMIGAELAERLGVEATLVGNPEPALNQGWAEELAAATPALRLMADRYEEIYAAGLTPVTALSRCAVALATLPVVARHHPDAVVLWFDSHADLNTPANTTTGYLGGLALSGPMGLWDSGFGSGLDSAKVILGGARDIDPAEQELIDGGTVRLLPVGPSMSAELKRMIGDRPVYFHLDCDVLEPGIVPTDYQVPGGMTLADLRAIAEVLAENRVVGVELGEFESTWRDKDTPFSPGPLIDAVMPMIDAARSQ
jgi:arginase